MSNNNGNNNGNKHNEEVIDIEEYAKNGKSVPEDAKAFKIKVDKEKFSIDHPIVTGRELLTLAGYVPVENYRLDVKMKGGATKQVHLDDTVDLRVPGLEKFMSIKLDQTEG